MTIFGVLDLLQTQNMFKLKKTYQAVYSQASLKSAQFAKKEIIFHCAENVDRI